MRRSRYSFLLLLAIASVACRSVFRPPAARYIVTDTPINLGIGPGVCIAADPLDREGVWWWEPGAKGCSGRSTGPGLFHAEHATVEQLERSGPVALAFRLPTHSTQRPFKDVRLLIEGDSMHAVDTGVPVSVHRRNALDIAER
jgi:hypothetical protein